MSMPLQPPPIFREASQSPLDSLSFDYSVDSESSCGGIETWISDQRSSPEILWEDQSMRLFRFRQSKRDDRSSKSAETAKSAPKATMSYPPKMSMSHEKYKRQHPPVSLSESNIGKLYVTESPKKFAARSENHPNKPRSVSLELAAAWLQMGESRPRNASTQSVGEATSASSSSSSSSRSSLYHVNIHPNQDRRYREKGSKNNGILRQEHEEGARPRWRSNSLSVSVSRQLWKQRPIRDTDSRAPRSGHFSINCAPHSTNSQSRSGPNKTSQHPPHGSVTKNDEPEGAAANLIEDKKRTLAQKTPCNIPKPSRRPNTYKSLGVFRTNNRDPPGDRERSERSGISQRRDPSGTMTAKTLWRTAVDPASGRTYYYHVETRETQWRKPLELASDEEKEEMRKKEERQRSFFAAMEVNILKNLESGAMVESTQAASGAEKTANFLQTRSVDGSEVQRPGLIRTISSMDRQVLSELVKRQPSNRRLFGTTGSSSSDLLASKFKSSVTSQDVLTDQTKALSLADYSECQVGAGNSRHDSDASLQRQASLGSILSALPVDDSASSRLGNSYLSSLGASSHYDESAGDFGVSDEEIDALAELAKISDKMSSLLDEDAGETKDSQDTSRFAMAGPRPSVRRASMTNISLEVLKEDSELSEHSTGENSPGKDTMATAEREKALKNVHDAGSSEVFEKPAMTRRNTCGTIYVGSTMSAPDKDATIKCICGVYRAHILQSEKGQNEPTDEFLIFNDLESQQKASKTRMQKVAMPSLEEITAFYRDVFRRSQMETDCIIMTLIYVERLIKRTDGRLRPRSSNWRSILFSCMILASKVWDDLSMWNADFSQTCPAGVRFSLQRINELELLVLSALCYDVKVPASEYAKYYFLLRSMLIKSGLGSEDLQTMNPLDVEGAKRLQQMSARYQASQTPRPTLMARSKSVSSVGKLDLKARLEHMVQM